MLGPCYMLPHLALVLAVLGLAAGMTYNTKYKHGQGFAALGSDGSILTWGDVGAGAEGTRRYNINLFASTYGAYAVVDNAGALSCWGDVAFGGDCSGVVSTDIQQLYAVNRMDNPTEGAFAAVDSAGGVFAWGSAATGAYFSDVAPLLAGGVISLELNGVALVAVKPNEVLVPWSSDSAYSGDPEVWSVVDQELATGSVERIYGNGDAFCVLKEDTTVFCWGDPAYLGAGPGAITGVVDIFTTDTAFAALDSSGTVTAWGNAANGGNIGGALTNVIHIASTLTAFAALIDDGTVFAWGDAANGGAVGAAYTDIISIHASHTAFAAIDSSGAVFGWGTDSTPAVGMDPIIDIVASRYAFAALSSTGNVYRWGEAVASTAELTVVAPTLLGGTMKSIYANDFAFAGIYGPDNDVVCWGDITYGGDCSALDTELEGTTYIYGDEMTRHATFQAPTVSPTPDPSATPTVAAPTIAPRRPSVAPTFSQSPTKSPLGAPFTSRDPTGMPTGQPTESVDPVVTGNSKNLTYYCRPNNYVSGKNAFQRIEPKIALNEAAGIVSAAVWVVPYEETDELSLRGSYGGTSHEIYATYAPGWLNVSRVEGSTSPIQWAEILQNVAYKFSDYLKPCSRYRNNYNRVFYFQVVDVDGRFSNIFSKGLTIDTASVVYSNVNTVQISQTQKLDANGNSARWIGSPP